MTTADFAALYGTHASFVRSVVRTVLKSPEEVDDTVQDVFVQALTQVARFDPKRGNLHAWLGTIARTRSIDRLRHRSVRKHTEPLLDAEGFAARDEPDPARLAEVRKTVDLLRAHRSGLPPATADVMRCLFEEDLSQRETAAHLGLTLGTVKSRLRQGLATLRLGVQACRSGRTGLDPGDSTEAALTVTEFQPGGAELKSGQPPLGDLQVLIVDDDHRTRAALGAVLLRAGVTPLIRGSAAEARAALDTIWPDVLLADITMPGEDGYSLIRHVRALERATRMSLPAIAFTARASEQDRTRALLAGFDLHMSKPVHPIAILGAIERLLTAKAAVPEVAAHAGVA